MPHTNPPNMRAVPTLQSLTNVLQQTYIHFFIKESSRCDQHTRPTILELLHRRHEPLPPLYHNNLHKYVFCCGKDWLAIACLIFLDRNNLPAICFFLFFGGCSPVANCMCWGANYAIDYLFLSGLYDLVALANFPPHTYNI